MQAAASRADAETKEPVRPKVETIKHRDSGVPIRGIRLGPGDVLQKGDRHDSPDGTWKCEDHLSGQTIKENCNSVWVRPVPEDF